VSGYDALVARGGKLGQSGGALDRYPGKYRPDLLPGHVATDRPDIGRAAPVRRHLALNNAAKWQRFALRPNGIYRLPGALLRFIARPTMQEGEYELYPTNAWYWSSQSDYRLAPDGRITYRGSPTVWRRRDLLDCGGTVPSRG
jgi:hypothetical protein